MLVLFAGIGNIIGELVFGEKREEREKESERDGQRGGLENYTFEVHLRIYLQKSQSRKGRKDAFLLRIFHLAIHKSDSNTTFFFHKIIGKENTISPIFPQNPLFPFQMSLYVML